MGYSGLGFYKILSEADWIKAVEMWSSGKDTFDIAHEMGCHESLIFNLLPLHRVNEGKPK